MFTEPCELIHFYNPDTKTSLELPVGWEEQSSTETTTVYADLDEDDDDGRSPRFIVSIQPLPNATDVRSGILDQVISQLDQVTVLDRRQILIDEVPAERVVVTYPDARLGRALRVHAVAQLDDVVWNMVGIALGESATEQRSVFEKAIDSTRVVLP